MDAAAELRRNPFSGVVNVKYPTAYEKFLGALSIVNLDLGAILSASCVAKTNFHVRLILVTVGPIVGLGALAITYRIAINNNGHSINAMRMAKNKHLSVGFFFLLIVYFSVSYITFQTFVCDTTLDSEPTHPRADYSILCSTDTHTAYMTYAGLVVLVYPIGVPAAFLWLMLANRREIKNAGTILRIGSRARPRRLEAADATKDLWEPYKLNRYYYEVIECGRRVALTGLAVFIYPGSTAQVAVEALFAVLFSTVSEELNPFANAVDAWLCRFGTWVVFLSMYLALLLKMNAADQDTGSQTVFAGLLIAAHGGMILLVMANAVMPAWKRFTGVRVVEMPNMARNQVAPQMMSPARSARVVELPQVAS